MSATRDAILDARRVALALQRPPRIFTDAELTEIYNRANGITGGKSPPITTQRIFTAMRAMRDLP